MVSIPLEIQLRILLFCSNPVPLARTSKRLYILFKHPVTLANWLAINYDNPILAALSLWSKDITFRKCINLEAPFNQTRGNAQNSSIAVNMFRNIKPCEICHGTQINLYSRCSSFESRALEIRPFLTACNDKFTLFSNINCPFERLQWQIILLLLEKYEVNFSENSNRLIRFAALSRHMGLLGLILTKMGRNEVSNRNDMIFLFTDAIEARNIMVTYECIQNGILEEIGNDSLDKIIRTAMCAGYS
jgi:hypothetical protein